MEIGIGKALQYSGLGIGIVFAMIIVLMIVVTIMSRIIRAATEKNAASVPATESAADADAASKTIGTPAPGSAGDVKLYNVSDRDAAMIMAIVADKLQTPLNELRFLSIREITDDQE